MVNQQQSPSPQLAWLNGIYCCAVVCLLVYQTQQFVTDEVFIPQPSGLQDNWQQIIAIQNSKASTNWLDAVLSLPAWFGFQWLNILIMGWGFSLASAQHGRSLEPGPLLRRSLLSLLWPLWSVVWLAFPMLWALEIANQIEPFSGWGLVASGLFPLTFDFRGKSLEFLIHPGWLIPTLISLTLLFPLIWQLIKRWGVVNLLLASLVITVGYRVTAIYLWNAYPTYVMPVTAIVGNGQPFALFVARLTIFVVGVVVGRANARSRGPCHWPWSKALLTGSLLYSLGFICQFYRWGWAIDEILVAAGLGLISMVGFRLLCQIHPIKTLFLWAGAYAYPGLLLQGLVIDHIGQRWLSSHTDRWYWGLLPIALTTLLLSILVNYLSPYLQRLVKAIGRDIHYVLTQTPPYKQRMWRPQVGDSVCYQDLPGWTVLKVEPLLDEREFLLCKVSNGERSLWVNEDDLEREIGSLQKSGFRSNSA